MKPFLHLICGVLVGLASAVSQGHAETAGATYASEQVTLQLRAEEPDADGLIRAALLVDLAPGWKTYWRDPGEAGIPPTLDLSASRNLGPATIGFPAPHRFGDEYGMSNGYSAPMAVAFSLTEKLPGETTEIRLKVMLGVCQQICIPVQAELALTLPDGDETGQVADAFARLPAANDPATGIAGASLSDDGKHLVITTAEPLDPAAGDVFVAGPRGWSFGAPDGRTADGDGAEISLPVLSRPRQLPPEPLTVDAVLTQPSGAVEARHLVVASPPIGSTPVP